MKKLSCDWCNKFIEDKRGGDKERVTFIRMGLTAHYYYPNGSDEFAYINSKHSLGSYDLHMACAEEITDVVDMIPPAQVDQIEKDLIEDALQQARNP